MTVEIWLKCVCDRVENIVERGEMLINDTQP